LLGFFGNILRKIKNLLYFDSVLNYLSILFIFLIINYLSTEYFFVQNTILTNNPIFVNFNFINKQNHQPNYYDVPYDLSSIMHYNGNFIRALDQKRSFLMGQRIGLSFLDIKLANLGYKCSGE
jgi:hypothetical protein